MLRRLVDLAPLADRDAPVLAVAEVASIHLAGG